jgi:hypothetical protein
MVVGVLPPELTFVSCTSTPISCFGTSTPNSTQVFAYVGELAAQSSATIDIVVNVTRSRDTKGRFFTFFTDWTVNSLLYDPAPFSNHDSISFEGINPNPDPLTAVTSIGTGTHHSLAIMPGGRLAGWGSNELIHAAW